MQLQEIAERCKQGDREAFALLYAATREQLRAVCLRYVHDEAVADDLLHDAFLLIFSKIGELKETARTEAWLTMVMRRVSLLYLRKLRQQGQEPLSSCDATSLQSPTVENSAESSLAVQEILAAVDSLPEGYRRVFRLSVLEGISHQEIAALLNIEPHSSSSQLARAKRMLQRIMSGYWVALLLLLVPVGFWQQRPVKRPQAEVMELQQKPEGLKRPQAGVVELQQKPEGLKRTQAGVKPLQSRGINVAPKGRQKIVVSSPLSGLPAEICMKDSSKETSGCAETPPFVARTDSTLMTSPAVPEVSEAPFVPAVPEAPSVPLTHWHINLAYTGQLPRANAQMALPYADADTNPMVSDSVSCHHLPLTVSLSVAYRLNRHWQLGTGLSYSRLTSDFCSGNSYVSLQQHQTVQSLGVPFSIAYLSPLTSHLSLLASASTTLHLPLRSTLESHYLLPNGIKAEPTTQILCPALHWSAGVGIGLQYEFVPHASLFVQPSLQYHFKDGSGISTWNTEHPFVLSVPFGVIISF